MWTQVNANDSAGLARHVAIMQQMDSGYLTRTPADLKLTMAQEQGEVWHYQGQGFEIAILFQNSLERGHWLLEQLGFVGNIQPAQVLDIVVLRLRDFFQSKGVPTFLAAPPKKMDYPPLLLFYSLCLSYPNLQITVLRETTEKAIWEVAYVGP